MNKYNISTIFLLSLALVIPMVNGIHGHGGYYHGGYGRGYGYGRGWIAPAVVSGALAGTALAASAYDYNQIDYLRRENRDLREQIDRQNRQIRRLEQKLEVA